MLMLPRMRGGVAAATQGCQVLIIDRQTLFLAAVARLLGEAPFGAEVTVRPRSDGGLRFALDNVPDVVLCDLRASPLAGPALAAVLAPSKTRVILLADPEDSHSLAGALACGAAGFFTKDVAPDEFKEGLLAVLAGHYVVGRGLARLAIERLAGGAGRLGALDGLTAIQRSILVLAGQGKPLKSIAQVLGRAEVTVRGHFARACQTLDLHGRPDVVRFAVGAGLVGDVSDRLDPVPGLVSQVESGQLA